MMTDFVKLTRKLPHLIVLAVSDRCEGVIPNPPATGKLDQEVPKGRLKTSIIKRKYR